MIFVNTSLDVALERNKKEREVYQNILQENHMLLFKVILVNFKIVLVWVTW